MGLPANSLAARLAIVREAVAKAEIFIASGEHAVIGMAAANEMKLAIAALKIAQQKWAHAEDGSFAEGELLVELNRNISRCVIALSVANGERQLGDSIAFAEKVPAFLPEQQN